MTSLKSRERTLKDYVDLLIDLYLVDWIVY